jgi:hypothetical protein
MPKTPSISLLPSVQRSEPIQDRSDKAPGLDNIADDVHYLIASELMKSSPAAILALGQSSKILRQAMLPFIYRDLVLKRVNYFETGTRQAYEALIERFRKVEDRDIATHVRSLTVKDDVPEKDLLLILDRVSELGSLTKLR